MASVQSIFRVPNASQCLLCMRRVAASAHDGRLSPAQHQVRGKKRVTRTSTINVRLLKDMPRYGRKGSIIPVEPGRMRNSFYPTKTADYVTKAQLQELGLDKEVFHRDWTFGGSQAAAVQAPSTDPVSSRSIRAVHLDLLDGEQATKLMNDLLPDVISFYRSPIAATSPHRRSPSIPITSAVSVAAQDSTTPEPPLTTGIYGSVSTADIAANLKAVLAEDADGSRIVLSADDITFIGEVDEKDRAKHLGSYDIEIRARGATNVVRRTIKINAEA